MISTAYNEIAHLLDQVGKAQKYNEKIERLKGEKFNVFSILGLERRENKTHSAFIGELLNPSGAHLKGNAFLNCFLDVLEIEDFDTSQTTLTLERYIGPVDFEKITGGQIDIEIKSRNGATICIENKIDAGDQKLQIARYCNFNKGKNTVFYLTLDGREPDENSSMTLDAGKDFECISYNETILEWLQKCLQLATEEPILRESIKQYIILIKKLTGQLTDKQMEKELEELLLKSPKAAELIYHNFSIILDKIREDFRERVIAGIKPFLPADFVVEKGNHISKPNSQIWVKHISNGKDWFPCYGIETFSGRGNFEGQLIYGIICNRTNVDQLPEPFRQLENRGWWMQYTLLRDYQGCGLNFADASFIAQLGQNHFYRDELVAKVVEEFKVYFEETKNEFLKFFKGIRITS